MNSLKSDMSVFQTKFLLQIHILIAQKKTGRFLKMPLAGLYQLTFHKDGLNLLTNSLGSPTLLKGKGIFEHVYTKELNLLKPRKPGPTTTQ